MDSDARDLRATALAAEDQLRAEALDMLRSSPLFLVTVLTTDGALATAGSVSVDVRGATFMLGHLAMWWEALHGMTEQNDAELFVDLMRALALVRNDDVEGR